MPVEVLIPLLNPNEPEAHLVALHVSDGQVVTKGDVLCTLETTKTTLDLEAETSGFIVAIRFTQGQIVRAGELFGYIAESLEWRPPANDRAPESPQTALPSITDVRITQPALFLAQSKGLDLTQLPVGPLITEKFIQEYLDQQDRSKSHEMDTPVDPRAIIIYGGGGHGKSLIDLIQSLRLYDIYGIVDDSIPAGEVILGVSVMGGANILSTIFTKGVRLAVNAVGGIGNLTPRLHIFNQLSNTGFTFPLLVHPTACVESSAQLSSGVQIFPHTYVGSESKIGFGTIINTGAIVSHDCTIGAYSNLSPGAILAGGVEIGEGVLIGMGVTVNLGVKIGSGARIGNGATVKNDIPVNGLVRAGMIWQE